jgi:peptidylprolyl isomerase
VRVRSLAVIALGLGVAGLGVALLLDLGGAGDPGEPAPPTDRAPASAAPTGAAALATGARPSPGPAPARIPLRRAPAEVKTTVGARPPRAPVATPGFELTRSGLQVKDAVVGRGPAPRPGQTVVVHYTGWLEDGDREAPFDDSRGRGAPVELPFGKGMLVPGFEEALSTMAAGGRRTVIIPAGLAYGDTGSGSVIPPGATLRFEIELVDVRDATLP